MKVKYSPLFLAIQKKVDVRIRKKLKEKVAVFIQDPNDVQLNNHLLRENYSGYRSINITADWRAVYKEIQEGEDVVAYFVDLGTHEQLYSKSNN